jgi:DNA-binding response OmpR family regulator
VTAGAQARDVMRNYDMGANSYVIKPVDFDQFTDLIRKLENIGS